MQVNGQPCGDAAVDVLRYVDSIARGNIATLSNPISALSLFRVTAWGAEK
jgi:hypothetical protein